MTRCRFEKEMNGALVIERLSDQQNHPNSHTQFVQNLYIPNEILSFTIVQKNNQTLIIKSKTFQSRCFNISLRKFPEIFLKII